MIWRQLEELPVLVLSEPTIVPNYNEHSKSIVGICISIWRLLNAKILQGIFRQPSANHGGRPSLGMQFSF